MGDRFYSLGDRKNCRPNRKTPFGDKKRARGGALSYVAQQRYNKNGRNANRPRTAGARQEAKFCISMRIVPVVGSGQWVRPRSSAMSIDVALSTRRGVGRDTYSLPKKTRQRREWHVNGHGTTKLRSRWHVNGHATTKLRPGAMSTDFVFVTWIHSRCEEATTRFEAQDG